MVMLARDPARRRSKLHSAVVADFEERILSGILALGDRMPSEAQIALEFGISTRSVREAMQVLETKGLIRRRHGERAEIVRDDIEVFLGSLTSILRSRFSSQPDYITDLMNVRSMFEERAAGWLAFRGGAPGPHLHQALDRMRDSVKARSFTDYAEADAAFHRALVDSVGNEILSSLYQNLFALITDVIRVSVRVPSKPIADGLAEHEAILDSIRNDGPEAAQTTIRAHIERSRSYIERALGNHIMKGGNDSAVI